MSLQLGAIMLVTHNATYYKLIVPTTVNKCNELCIDHQICYK